MSLRFQTWVTTLWAAASIPKMQHDTEDKIRRVRTGRRSRICKPRMMAKAPFSMRASVAPSQVARVKWNRSTKAAAAIWPGSPHSVRKNEQKLQSPTACLSGGGRPRIRLCSRRRCPPERDRRRSRRHRPRWLGRTRVPCSLPRRQSERRCLVCPRQRPRRWRELRPDCRNIVVTIPFERSIQVRPPSRLTDTPPSFPETMRSSRGHSKA